MPPVSCVCLAQFFGENEICWVDSVTKSRPFFLSESLCKFCTCARVICAKDHANFCHPALDFDNGSVDILNSLAQLFTWFLSLASSRCCHNFFAVDVDDGFHSLLSADIMYGSTSDSVTKRSDSGTMIR